VGETEPGVELIFVPADKKGTMNRATSRIIRSAVLGVAFAVGISTGTASAQDTGQGTAGGPTTQQTSTPTNSGTSITLGAGIGPRLETIFKPRTEQIYFSPFEIMNPSHIRPDLPMEIGSYKDLHLDMGFQSVGRFQAIQQENVFIKGAHQKGLNPGIQDPFANLDFLASVPGKLDVYFDLYVASRPHPNTMYAHEGYILLKSLPEPFEAGPLGKAFDYINVKVGGFDIDFGDGNYRRSNNAFVQRNPLITNPLVDPNVEELGGEVYSVQGPIYWLAGAGGGTTTEHFDYGAGASGHAKIWANPLPELRTSASVYYADLSGSANANGNEHSDLYAAQRSGGALSSVFGGGDSPGQVLPMSGDRMVAVQGDVTWNHWPFDVYANVGWTQDTNANGPLPGHPAERWIYGTIEPSYHITPAWYVAGRYGVAAAQAVHGVDTHGWVDRAEIGTGYWITESILAKAEYVYEQYHDFRSGTGIVSGVDTGGRSPRFNGILVEVSFSF